MPFKIIGRITSRQQGGCPILARILRKGGIRRTHPARAVISREGNSYRLHTTVIPSEVEGPCVTARHQVHPSKRKIHQSAKLCCAPCHVSKVLLTGRTGHVKFSATKRGNPGARLGERNADCACGR